MKLNGWIDSDSKIGKKTKKKIVNNEILITENYVYLDKSTMDNAIIVFIINSIRHHHHYQTI